MAKDMPHTTQHTARAHRCKGAKWPRTMHTQHNTPSQQNGEQKPSSSGRRTHSTTHPACATVSRGQGSEDTAQTTQHAEHTNR